MLLPYYRLLQQFNCTNKTACDHKGQYDPAKGYQNKYLGMGIAG